MNADYLMPADGVCPACDRLRRGNPEVDRILALRGLRYYDERRGGMVTRDGVRFCKCKEET